jgi:hypothetical protein
MGTKEIHRLNRSFKIPQKWKIQKVKKIKNKSENDKKETE